jgi:hypothetical protein
VKEPAKETKKEAPKDAEKQTAKEPKKELPKETVKEPAKETKKEAPKDAEKQTTKEPKKEAPKEAVKEPAKEAPAKSTEKKSEGEKGQSPPHSHASMWSGAAHPSFVSLRLDDASGKATGGGKPTEKADNQGKAASSAAPVPAAKPEAAKPPKPAATPAAQPAPAAKPPAPKPLSEKMKTFIRNELALGKIEKTFQPLRQDIIDYSNEWGFYEADKARGVPAAAPPEPNFAKLAKENGLSFHREGLMSHWDVRELDIGKSMVPAGNRGGTPVSRAAFDLGKFSPRQSVGRPDELGLFAKDHYLFWKMADEREEVPKFEAAGVRDEVLKTWKLIEARDLAKKKAESLAAEAHDAHKSFHAMFADQPNVHVLMPPKFSWLPPRQEANKASETGVSEVKGLKLPGGEFMRAVFGLQPGGTAVAFNAPQTIAYAIYLDDLTPSFNVRWDEFQLDPFSNYQAIAMEDQLATERAWIAELKHSVDFQELTENRQAVRAPREPDEPIDFGGF